MSNCKRCDGSGWYSITAAEFERKHGVITDLAPDQLMSFPCDHTQIDNEPCAHGVMVGECVQCELRSPALPGGLAADTGAEGDV